MTAKLNLTINDSIVHRIKSYARRKKTSVSKIVEKQLEEILNGERKDDSFKNFIEKFGGSIKRDKPIDVKQERDQYLKKKYEV